MEKNMTTGRPIRLIMTFALPLFIGNVFQLLYNVVDTLVVGRFIGTEALAAVGASGPSFNLIITLVNGFSGGASVILSQIYGSGNNEALRRGYFSALKILLIFGVLLTALGFLVAGGLLRLMRTPDDIFYNARLYLYWMCGGMITTCLYNMLSGLLRSVGNSVTPLFALIGSTLLNGVLDVLFVAGLHWGISGAAFATILSQVLSGLYCWIYIEHKMPDFHFSMKEFSIDRDIVKEMVRIGIPTAVASCATTVSTILIQSAINGYGSKVIAAYIVGSRAENIGMCLSYSFGMAVGVFTAQNTGAKKLDRVRQGLFSGLRISLCYHVGVAAAEILFARQLASVFTSDSQIIALSIPVIQITAMFAPVLGALFIFQNFLRNVSDIFPTIIMSAAEVFSRGLLPYVYSTFFGFSGIWWATPTGWTISLVIGIMRYASGKWKNAEDSKKLLREVV